MWDDRYLKLWRGYASMPSMASSLQERRSSAASREASSRSTKPARRPGRPGRGIKRKKWDLERLQTYFTIGLFIFSLVFLLSLLTLIYWPNRHGSSLQQRSITPLPAPRVTDLPQFQGNHQEDLFWGTYRPHLYLGIRARAPKSLLAGLMWMTANDGMLAIRHTCEASDNLRQYGWLRHDGVSYGRQEIVDGSVLISTTFLKARFPTSGFGGDWAVRLSLKDISAQVHSPQTVMSVLFYLADEAGSSLKLTSKGWITKRRNDLVSGVMKGLGDWQLYAVGTDETEVHYAGYATTHMHNLTQLVQQTLEFQARTTNLLQLPDSFQDSSNIVVFQFNFKLPFEIDLVFVSGNSNNESDIQARVQDLSGSRLSKRILEKESTFEDRFQETFDLQEKDLDQRSIEVGKAALSNLLGGIGYFFGQSRIAVPSELQVQTNEQYWLYWPAALYTAVPSRSMFPRGFLWDEGFHQLLIRRWDKNISMDIIGHWMDLINMDGWIPREQILGDEARSKVPEEFVLQHTSNANPPTLFLAFHDFLLDLKKSTQAPSQHDYDFLRTCFPRLEAWFKWFNTTQVGEVHGSYFWHGRSTSAVRELNPKTLSSGLDDYPRASHPSTDERHLDLHCWMALAARSMALISSVVDAESLKYEETAKWLSDLQLLNKLHYDPVSGRYCDYGNHTEKVKLAWNVWQDPKTGYMHRDLVRETKGHPRLRLVPHFGYVSLFPFIMKIIPADSPILQRQLELIQDETLLWTGFGLRSLATTSSLYMKRNTEHDPPYWRGPVWINLNYLILTSLHHYSKEPGPYKDSALQLYLQLRQNLIRNVVDSYYESGYLWEQYDNTAEGRGKGAHPFTGWTSLILLIMAETF